MILASRTKDAYHGQQRRLIEAANLKLTHSSSFRRTSFARSRINYYNYNTCASFNYERLCLCGDIISNPSPESLHRIYAVCGHVKAKKHRAITCGSCYHPIHIKCSGLTPLDLKRLEARGNYYWTCPPCLDQLRQLPFANINNLDSSYSLCTCNTG